MSHRFDEQDQPENPAREDVSLSDVPVTNRKSPAVLIVSMLVVLVVIVLLLFVVG